MKMMSKVLFGFFVLSQLTINQFECFFDEKFVDENPEHSVQTCFTRDSQPAFCVDQSLCQKVVKDFNLADAESCPRSDLEATSDKVCCPIDTGAEYRDAFVVPSGLAWDWSQAWPTMPWAQPPRPIVAVAPTTTKAPSTPAAPSNGSSSPAPTPVAANPNGQSCGVRNNFNIKEDDKGDLGFIVGGEEAKPHSWQWACAMNSSGRFVCGGSIIDQRHILCAAHCVSHNKAITKADQIKILVGSHNRYKTGEYYGVEKVIVHSGYNERIMQNDIAIFKLDRNIAFSKTVGPVCLPKSCDRDCPEKSQAYLAGWGTTSAGGRVSDNLREVSVPVIPLRDCQRAYDSTMVTSKQICAGLLGQGGKDTCQGDSGGPMAIRPQAKENKHVQCGIVSWGKGCADGKYPGVYTKVCEFLSWIADNTKN